MKRQASIMGALALLLGGLAAPPAPAAELQTVIKGIDIVGVPASQVTELLGLMGLQEGMRLPYAQIKDGVVRRAESALTGTGRFRTISVQPTTFIGGQEDGATYLTIGLVDRSVSEPPARREAIRIDLPPALTVFFAERVRGLGAFRDTLLPSDRDRLEGLSETHVAELERALAHADDPDTRRLAAQAIAFHPDALRARQQLEKALGDPDAGVRRDAARALQPLVARLAAAAALDPYLALIRSPESADRLSAAALLIALARTPESRARIFREAGAPMLAMARMKHPAERTLAMEGLQILSEASAPEPWENYRQLWEEKTKRRFTP